ncbi:MAG: DUF3566 domain-containing protein [Acidimicrobiia bacterium]
MEANRPQAAAKSSVQVQRVVHARQFRQTIRHVDVWSVLKVSLCFYTCGFFVLLIAGSVMWIVAASAGLVRKAESFMNELLLSDDFKFLPVKMLEGALLVGVTTVAILTVLTVVAATFYNLFGEMVGGLEVTVVEEDMAAADL